MTSVSHLLANIRTKPPEFEAYVIGQDVDGHWLALEVHGRGGGIFRDRAAAVHFAQFETDHRLNAVRFAPQPLSLDFVGLGQVGEPMHRAA